MLRQVWHVLVVSLLLSFSINTQGQSSTVSFSTTIENATVTAVEIDPTIPRTTLETTTNISEPATTTSVSESTTASTSTTTASESTATASESTADASGSTSTSAESTTTASESTRGASESTTDASESTSTGAESTTTASESTTASTSTTTASESTATASESTADASGSTSTSAESTTTGSESTRGASESTTASTSTTTASESKTTASELTIDASESTTDASESTSTGAESTTTASESTTTASESTRGASESTSTGAESATTGAESTTTTPESLTTENVSGSDSTSSVSELGTTESTDNQTDETSTTNAPKALTTESLDFNSTVDSTANYENVPVHKEVHDFNDYFPHTDNPQWIHTNPSKPKSLQKDIPSSSDELIGEITHLLAEYISNQTSNSSVELSSGVTDLIATELQDKLDRSGLNIDDDDRAAVRGTVKLIIKNLPFIIQAIVSNIEKAGQENCLLKFTFYNNMYCVNFKVDVASTPTRASPSLIETTTTTSLPENISIESFHVSNTDGANKLPITWQQWLPPSSAQDRASSFPDEPAVVCYYTNWAQYRNGPGRFYPENIDTNFCTHIVYAFAKLENGVIAPYEWNDESTPWSTGMYARMMILRKNKRPKILLAVGGWNHGSENFSDMVQNKTQRATFITTTIIFLQKHNFDGLDFDWEYPGSREGSRPTDKANYISLIVELKKAFRPHSLLLTAAVGAGKSTIDAGYDIPKVCETLDLVNLMVYDLHGSWETETGLHTALFARQNDTTKNEQLTVDWAVRYWLDKGCSPSKLVLGLALYGRTFRLASSLNNKIGAPAVGPGSAGLYTGEAGFLGYYEICTRIQQQSWTKVFDEERKSNYAYRGVEWVGFDDTYSIGLKAQYAKDMGLAGIMFWAADLDDFSGTSCNEGKYPLMNTAVNLLRGRTVLNTSPKSPTLPIQPTPTPTTLQEGKRVVCYYTNWAQYRPDEGKFGPEDLDASLCTHINFAFAVLKDSKLVPFEWNDEDSGWSKGMYSRIIALKNTHKVKILLALGGWNFGAGAFSDMAGDERLRKEFIQQATQYVRDHQFDGLDLDWEFPGSREGSRSRDKHLFTVLVKELKAALQPYNLLLTAAIGAGASTIENGYEIDQLAPHLDFINLMSYDLHGGAWENFTGLHTALYARREEYGKEITLNQNWAVNYFIQQGMPKEKITMGLAIYGRTFQLVNSSNTGIGAPSSGPGAPGRFTREPGYLSYYEICEKLNSGLWKSIYDDEQKSIYAYGEGMWVGYDNVDTMIIRANYIIEKDLGGVMIWAPDLDDFSGKFCNQGRYPLMNTVVNLIRMGIILPIDIPTVLTSTKTTSTSTPSLLSPSANVTPPSVVCMTTVNPFVFETVDVKLCSHLILVGINIDADVSPSALSSDTLEQLKTMRNDNRNLKIFYSMLGRWKVAHLDLIRDAQSRRKLNQQIKRYLIDNHLDGFDIDWNIQADQITSLTDKYQLSTWLLELRTDFHDSQLSLSIGINGDKTVLDNSYEFDQISSTVDFLRLMAFDWPSEDVTSLINPLFPVNNDPLNNINWAVDYLLTLGVPPEQISLGIPTHGRWFRLADSYDHSVGSPVTGPSMLVAYSDICKLIKTSDYIKAYDHDARSSYTYNLRKKQWISFNTVNDVALKAHFAKLEGLGGVTLSALEMDDVDEQCGHGPYPLLHAVSNIFNNKTKSGSEFKNTTGRSNPLKQKNVFCSVSPNAEEHSDVVAFTLEQIGTDLCTHLLIDHRSSLLSASIADQLKNIHSDLKILLTFNADEFEDNNQWKREIKKKKADGLNLRINSDTFSGKTTKLIQSIRAVLADRSLFTISFRLPSIPSQQASFFDVLQLHSSVDYMLILPFDGESIRAFNTIQPWNSLATFVPANFDQNVGDFSMISILLFIILAGVPNEKIIPGIATFGLSFQLENESRYQIGDRITGPGFPGRVTDREGLLSSYEICEHIQADEYQRFLSNDSIIILAHHKTDLITFDDTVPIQLNETTTVNGTVELKAIFIKNAQFGGVLVHGIEMDDYTGSSCHRGIFPITSVISRVFSTSVPSTSSPPPSPLTTMGSVQNSNPCADTKFKDLIADETDCRYYYVCMPGHEEPVAHLQCPNNMQFSPKQKACSQEQFPCTPKSKFNRSTPSNEVPLAKAETPFVCPTPTGIFPDPSDCTRFLACSNNIVVAMKCPLKTKFNPQSNRCDWTVNSCP